LEWLRRFKEREETSYKQYKITDEDDWRNRLKWDDYAAAASDMVDRTSTEYAPWTLVAAESKYHAREGGKRAPTVGTMLSDVPRRHYCRRKNGAARRSGSLTSQVRPRSASSFPRRVNMSEPG
jgi:hypothetical protein